MSGFEEDGHIPGCKNPDCAGCREIEQISDTDTRWQAKYDALAAEGARLREAMGTVSANDKTEYDYRNAGPSMAKNRNGCWPPAGERWMTPKEIAEVALSNSPATSAWLSEFRARVEAETWEKAAMGRCHRCRNAENRWNHDGVGFVHGSHRSCVPCDADMEWKEAAEAREAK